MTVVATYLVFYMSDVFFSVSGAISTVTWGLFMSAYGKTFISPDSEHLVHSF